MGFVKYNRGLMQVQDISHRVNKAKHIVMEHTVGPWTHFTAHALEKCAV